MRLVAAIAIGLVAAAAAAWILLAGLPLGRHVRRSLLPWEAAASVGVLAGIGHLALRDPRMRSRFALVALALGTAAVILASVLAAVPEAMLRGSFPSWIPLCAGSGLGLWLAGVVLERRLRRRLPAFTALLAGIALATVNLQVGKYQYDAFTGRRVRAWNVFHYYVGAKYFPELSYYDLYAATLAADDDFQRRKAEATGKRRKRLEGVEDFARIKSARDQHDYANKPRDQIVAAFDRSRIGKERLEQLGRDTRFLRKHMGFGNPGWKQCFTDLGFNPAPPWTVVGTAVSNVVPLKWPWFWLISNSDVPLYLLTFALLWWAFGLRITSLIAIWLCSAQLNEARFTGGFLQYDWMCSTLSALALYHRGRHRLAGVTLSWAAMTRAFPGFLVFGIALKVAVDLFGRVRSVRGGPGARRPTSAGPARFLLAFALACATLFAASHLTGRGLATWPEWFDKIARHADQHAVTSNMRIGVGRLAIHAPRPGRFWADAPGSRDSRLAQGAGRKHLLQAIGLVLLLLALPRRRDEDAFVLMLFSVFCLVVLSRYYASVWAMLFVLGGGPARGHPGERPPWKQAAWPALVSGSVLLLLNAAYFGLGGTTAAYYVINYAVYGLFCFLCLAWIAGDCAALARRSLERRAARAVELAPSDPADPHQI